MIKIIAGALLLVLVGCNQEPKTVLTMDLVKYCVTLEHAGKVKSAESCIIQHGKGAATEMK